ncbi:hypothetical protein SUGI_0092110 [Cryptomeria japonica]|nr:hypothetical protein SUGI_0092110 [Cryptomeria japonica]
MESSSEKLTSMNPKDLRFTQRSIKSTFSDDTYPSVRESVSLIQRGELDPAVYGELTVHRDEQGVVWCVNNRRLYVVRMAGVSSVRVKFNSNDYMARRIKEADKKMMNDPDFLPKIRGEKSGGPSPLPPISSQTETSMLGGAPLPPISSQQETSLLGVLGAVCTALVAAYWGWKLFYAPVNNQEN